MLSAIIFDMDGVVIDSHPIHKRSWSLFLQSVGKTVSDDDLEFVREGTKRNDILRHFLGDLSEHELHEYGLQKEALFRRQAISMQPIPGFLDFIARVTSCGIPAALASSGSKNRVNYILDHLEVGRHFAVVITGDDVKSGKPDPTIFRLAGAKLGALPSQTLVFEDAVAGVQAARAAGMRCIGVADSSRAQLLRRAGAEDVIPDFLDLTPARVAAKLRPLSLAN
jgi:HAD superfamily hydrolase (TIGR01509 family)